MQHIAEYPVTEDSMDGQSAGAAAATEPGVIAASVYSGGRRISEIAIGEAGLDYFYKHSTPLASGSFDPGGI